MRSSLVRAGLGVAVSIALAGCRQPTQIEVQVSTNVACTDWQGSAVAVGQLGPDLENAPASTTSMTCDDAGHVGTVVMVPAGDDGANVALKVVGAVGAPGTVSLEACTAAAGYANCIVARRALRFIAHESLTLAVPLEQACDNDPCAPDQTCVAGQCRSATVPDPSQCADQTCGEGVLPPVDGGGGGDGGDASVSDGGSAFDATVSDAATADANTTNEDASVPPFDASYAGCGTHCALAVGASFTCVAREGGVVCAGENYNYELGQGPGAPTQPGAVSIGPATPLASVTGIVAGEDTSCAYVAGGGVACWGGGSPLGLTDGGNVAYATLQPALAGSPQIAIGDYHMCAVTSARQLVCQEATYMGEESVAFDDEDGGAAPVTLPPPSGTLPPFLALGTTRYFTCALATDGTVYCLGDDQNGSESNPAGGNANVTTFTAVQSGALDLALSETSACVRTSSKVLCWGEVSGATTFAISEVTYADGGSIASAVQLAGGSDYHCARLASGQVACWGNNAQHQLGRGESTGAPGGASGTAALVVMADGGAFGGATQVAAGTDHTCALVADGSLWCWGDNGYGQVLPGGAAAYSVPTASGF